MQVFIVLFAHLVNKRVGIYRASPSHPPPNQSNNPVHEEGTFLII